MEFVGSYSASNTTRGNIYTWPTTIVFNADSQQDDQTSTYIASEDFHVDVGEEAQQPPQTEEPKLSEDSDTCTEEKGEENIFDLEDFIEVRKYPAIWNTSHPFYKSSAKKRHSWNTISQKLNF